MLQASSNDATLRIGAVTNPDGSCSIAVINWGEKKRVRIASEHPIGKPLRIYEYDSANPPFNAFNDLQQMKGTVRAEGGCVSVAMPAKSLVFLTTDYIDRTPAAVANVRMVNGHLHWAASEEPEHCYYRVYRDGRQIASTVATSLPVSGVMPKDLRQFAVKSVDKWGNVGK